MDEVLPDFYIVIWIRVFSPRNLRNLFRVIRL